MTASLSRFLLLVCGILLAFASPLLAKPRVFWASDPVRPNEAVLVQGAELAPATSVEMARLDDSQKESGKAELAWRSVPVLQPGDSSVKFIVPAEWKPGVFAFRIRAGDSTTDPIFLNAPDAWWMQGDEGPAATPGGWLRVLGKSLAIGESVQVRLEGSQGSPIVLRPSVATMYSLKIELPSDVPVGECRVFVHNGAGGAAGWRAAGTIRIEPATPKPANVFNVLETYGPTAAEEMRKSLIKYNQPVDRTEGIQAALKKAKDAGGGTVFFPAGRYRVNGPLVVPDHTTIKGEGEGLVTIWWGAGHFNLDGGGPQGRALVDEPKPPHTLISGHDFSIEDMSLYLPFQYEEGISCDGRFRMSRTRIRVDHYWLVQGRGGGTVARLGSNSQVTDCDILAKGDAVVPGSYSLIAHNRILSNKSNTPMGNSMNVIIEENDFQGMDPTSYQNISSVGRNIYYAHNRQQNLYDNQADYSFTFDAGTGAYLGGLLGGGTQLTLAADPVFPKWATETAKLWDKACVCILEGQGAGQWRDVVAHKGRNWTIDRPFDPPPDKSSVATILPFNGRVLVIGNRFEDANWVNAGYGASIDVIYAENELARCAELMNYGLFTHDSYLPSWHVQYFDNCITEGVTKVFTSGNGHKTPYTFPLTSGAVHRRETIAADNAGSIVIGGNMTDAIVEHCTLKNPFSVIRADGNPRGVLFRENVFSDAPAGRYEGSGLKQVLILPAPR